MKKNKNDWLTSFRTDGRTSVLTYVHCIALLHCIALHCIALHCIAYHWLNAMLMVHFALELCHRSFNKFEQILSWINSRANFLPLNVLPRSDLCVCLFVCPSAFFWLRTLRTDGQTYWLYATELKLNWNNWNLSVHPWHSYILTFYIDISILARGKMTIPPRPSVHSDFHFSERSWVRNLLTNFVILYFFKK
jgi:hypothetical protein